MRTTILWIFALAFTLALAFWQETTGPTYPIRGSAELAGVKVPFELLRSHGGDGDLPVQVKAAEPSITGEVMWRRWPTNDPFQLVPLKRQGSVLEAFLPHQPPAGKVEFQVRLHKDAAEAVIPALPAVARFKGDVSPFVLVPHILMMFAGLLFAARAGLDAALGRERMRSRARTAFGLLLIGGMILGPIVQRMAFGALWTGIPFGWDLTDNKTLIAVAAWIPSLWMMRKGVSARWLVLGAALVTFIVFSIPHSTWGSQIDWSKMPPPK